MLKTTAADPSIWTERDQAFAVAALHQIHCVVRKHGSLLSQFTGEHSKGTMKPSFLELERTGNITSGSGHIHHCLEVLRQAVVCAADLTLEKLDVEYPSEIRVYKPQRGNLG